MIMTAMVITQEMLNAGISKLEGTPTNPTTSQPSPRLRVSCPSKVLSSPSCWALPHLQRFQKNVESRWNRIDLHILNPRKRCKDWSFGIWLSGTANNLRPGLSRWRNARSLGDSKCKPWCGTHIFKAGLHGTQTTKVIEEPPAARCPGCCYHQCQSHRSEDWLLGVEHPTLDPSWCLLQFGQLKR